MIDFISAVGVSLWEWFSMLRYWLVLSGPLYLSGRFLGVPALVRASAFIACLAPVGAIVISFDVPNTHSFILYFAAIVQGIFFKLYGGRYETRFGL